MEANESQVKPDPDEVLSLRQAACVAGLHRSTIYEAALAGRLVAVLSGRSYRTTRRALDEYRAKYCRAKPEDIQRSVNQSLAAAAH